MCAFCERVATRDTNRFRLCTEHYRRYTALLTEESMGEDDWLEAAYEERTEIPEEILEEIWYEDETDEE